MGTLTLGMIGAWTVIAIYVGWLGIQQRRIGRRLDGLRQDCANAQDQATASQTPAGKRATRASRAA
jgi:hypothetical protein